MDPDPTALKRDKKEKREKREKREKKKERKEKKEKKQEKPVPTLVPPMAPPLDFRRALVNELIATEETYVEGLHRLQEVFVKKIEKQRLLAADVRRYLFGQINILLGMNERLLADLKKRHAAWEETSCISDIFLEFIPFMQIYSQYIENFDSSQKQLSNEAARNKKLAALLDQCQVEAGGQSIAAHMILPVQRLPRYQMLLRELVKKTDDSHPDVEGLNEALVKIVAVVTKVNAQKAVVDRRRKTMDKLASLNSNDSLILLHKHSHRAETNLVGMLEVVVDSLKVEASTKDRCFLAVSSPRETLKTKPLKMSDLRIIWKEEMIFLVKDPNAFDISAQLTFELHNLSSKKKAKVASFTLPIVDIKDKFSSEVAHCFDMYNPVNPTETVGTLRVSFAYVQDRMQKINVNAVGSTIGGEGIRSRRRSASITTGTAALPESGRGDSGAEHTSSDDMTLHESKRAERKKKSHIKTLRKTGGSIILRPLIEKSPETGGILDQLRSPQPAEQTGSLLEQLTPRGRKSSSSSKARSASKSPRQSSIKASSVQRSTLKSPRTKKKNDKKEREKKEREEKKKAFKKSI